jgi:Nucleotidyl transferase AbiEii toxin, Type IV TA system
MSQPSSKQTLYALQDAVIARLQAMNDPQLANAKLCGGTALARFWLDHRVSYDLDFFIPEGFKAGALAVALKKAGIDFEAQSLVDDARLANQLHGYVMHLGQRLKVSFIEDAYSALYPVLKMKLAKNTVQTECVEALYHRKLRTVSGPAREGDSFAGGRQTARDLFDLYVLSQRVMKLRPFMQSLPYAFPSAAFDNGLAHMPWFELMDELAEISCDAQWAQAKDVSFLQNALYQQIGAGIILDGDAHD